MLDGLIDAILDGLLGAFHDPRIVIVLVAILPIVEARLAIPIAIGYGLGGFESWLWSFLGSSAIVPILLLVLLPFINWLSKTKVFARLGAFLKDKFEKKAAGLNDPDPAVTTDTTASSELVQETPTAEMSTGATTPDVRTKLKTVDVRKREWKKALGVFLFVAVPMPLTGVWTGSAVAAIVKLPYPKALLAVIAGNLVASGIIALLSIFLTAYVNYIILAISLIAIAAVIVLLVKLFLFKPKKSDNEK